MVFVVAVTSADDFEDARLAGEGVDSVAAAVGGAVAAGDEVGEVEGIEGAVKL